MKRLNMELNNECRLARYTMRSALNVNYVKAVKEDLKYYASQIRKINNPLYRHVLSILDLREEYALFKKQLKISDK